MSYYRSNDDYSRSHHHDQRRRRRHHQRSGDRTPYFPSRGRYEVSPSARSFGADGQADAYNDDESSYAYDYAIPSRSGSMRNNSRPARRRCRSMPRRNCDSNYECDDDDDYDYDGCYGYRDETRDEGVHDQEDEDGVAYYPRYNNQTPGSADLPDVLFRDLDEEDFNYFSRQRRGYLGSRRRGLGFSTDENGNWISAGASGNGRPRQSSVVDRRRGPSAVRDDNLAPPPPPPQPPQPQPPAQPPAQPQPQPQPQRERQRQRQRQRQSRSQPQIWSSGRSQDRRSPSSYRAYVNRSNVYDDGMDDFGYRSAQYGEESQLAQRYGVDAAMAEAMADDRYDALLLPNARRSRRAGRSRGASRQR